MSIINIFLGGGVKLLHGDTADLKGYRNDVVDPVISQLNSQEHTKHLYIAKDYSDLTRNVVKGEQQEGVYNKYIRKDAHIALFIIDGALGHITKEEIDVAVKTYRKTNHPLVYTYGRNISDNNELLAYLCQEGIYYQHFYDNRDLAGKIKNDILDATKKIEKRRQSFWGHSVLATIVITGVILGLINTNQTTDNNTIESCTAQLYLMRYNDVNAITGVKVFEDSILSRFKYEDSVLEGNDRAVFPLFSKDSSIISTQPYFRLKLHNKHRNTIVFVEATLEVDNYIKDTTHLQDIQFEHTYTDIETIDNININNNTKEYGLSGFRQSVAYGEIDDRYFFTIDAPENCSFRMRVRAKSQQGEYLYSNYIYVRYNR